MDAEKEQNMPGWLDLTASDEPRVQLAGDLHNRNLCSCTVNTNQGIGAAHAFLPTVSPPQAEDHTCRYIPHLSANTRNATSFSLEDTSVFSCLAIFPNVADTFYKISVHFCSLQSISFFFLLCIWNRSSTHEIKKILSTNISFIAFH